MSDSPLLLRRQLLSAIEALSDEALPKQQRDNHIAALSELNQSGPILRLLVKELQRAEDTPHLMATAELLVELGSLDALQEPLWTIIESPTARDTTKDAANLVLRNLGDTTDPDTYLEYLEDPDALIAEETGRMLAMASENPSAMVDFLDFTVSLPAEEQVRLLESLRADYPTDQLLPLYLALYWYRTAPSVAPETIAFVQEQLMAMESPAATAAMADMVATTVDEAWHQQLSRELQKRRLRGEVADTPVHSLARHSTLHQCYVTLPDGIGNQGLMVVRQLPNEDFCLLAVAINDQSGILDSFGFYRLSDADVGQLVAKFHEANLKITASPEVTAALIQRAWWQSARGQKPIPYEFTCWSGLLDDVKPLVLVASKTEPPPPTVDWLAQCTDWVNDARKPLTNELYLHPDFFTWFLEREDSPTVATLLQQVGKIASPLMTADPAEAEAHFASLQTELETAANETMMTLLAQPTADGTWQQTMINRLALAAVLLNAAGNVTFASLAATEAHTLANADAMASLTPFMVAFGRRCVLEYLLRLAKQNPPLDGFAQHLARQWEPEMVLDGLLAELPPMPDEADDE